MKRKLRSKRGFSLAETLLAVLILLLVSLIVANGVPAAKNAYEKVVIGANAKVLLSTTIATLRDELATAKDVTVASDKSITYFSADKGSTSRIYLDPKENPKPIKIQEYIAYSPEGTSLPTVAARNLVPAQAATGDLYVKYDNVELVPEGTVYKGIIISNIGVYRESKPENAIASVEALTIRFIKPSATPTT